MAERSTVDSMLPSGNEPCVQTRKITNNCSAILSGKTQEQVQRH